VTAPTGVEGGTTTAVAEAPLSGGRRVFEFPADGWCSVHGESHYQPALNVAARTCRLNAEGERTFLAELVDEPENPHDANAIAVHAEGQVVGYLPRGQAAGYRPVFDELRRRGYAAASCQAKLVGGTDDKPSFGVTLRLSDPQECLNALEHTDANTG
jgi:HIRAN domain